MKFLMQLLLMMFFVAVICGFRKQNIKPNIIMILADDLGYGELGCYGQTLIKTPNLDRLASNGMRFTQYYSGNTVCAPSRCALLTGKHTGHADIRDNFEMGGFPDDEEKGQLPIKVGQCTIAHTLKANGYRTAIIGKWGLGMPNNEGNPKDAGFDFFYGYACQKQAHNYYPSHLWKNDQWDTLRNGYFSPHQKFIQNPDLLNAEYVRKNYTHQDYAPDLMRREALEFIAGGPLPFFLYYAISMPHLGLQVPLDELNQYRNLPDTPYLGNRQYLPHHRPRAAYAAMISRLEKEDGIILDALKISGQDKNTIIVLVSDNGATVPGIGGADTRYFKSNGSLRGYKMDLFEGGIRVPCIVSWPGKIKSGVVNPSVIASWDWLPTLADLTHSKLDNSGIDGLSLSKVLSQNQLLDSKRFLYWEYASYGGIRAIRIGDWKLIWFSKTKQGELYQLTNDVQEQANLIVSYPEKTKQLLALMNEAHLPSRITKWNIYE